MKMQPKTLALAVAGALSITATIPAYAFLTTSTTVNFSQTASVSDTCNTSPGSSCTVSTAATNEAPKSIVSPSLQQFDSSMGVLLGTAIKIDSTRTQTISGTILNAIAKSSTVASGASNGNVSAPGVSVGLSKISTSLTGVALSATPSQTFSNTDLGTVTNINQNVADAKLGDYVGNGTVAVNLTAPTLFQATSTWSGGKGKSTSSSAKYTLDWTGTASAEYSYLEHADGTISDGTNSGLALNLDFGSVLQFSTASPLDFFISNAFGDRVGLDFDSFSSSGDNAILTTDLFSLALGAGANYQFQAFLDTSNLGIFSAQYILNLSDEDVGAENSRYNNYQLTLNLAGKVIENPTAPNNTIPEPELLTLLGVGLMGLARRRRRLS